MGTYISHCLYRETNRLDDIEQRVSQYEELMDNVLTTHMCCFNGRPKHGYWQVYD